MVGNQVYLNSTFSCLRFVDGDLDFSANVDWDRDGCAVVGPGILVIAMTHNPSFALSMSILESNFEDFILISSSSVNEDQKLCFFSFDIFWDTFDIVDDFFTEVERELSYENRFLEISDALMMRLHESEGKTNNALDLLMSQEI